MPNLITLILTLNWRQVAANKESALVAQINKYLQQILASAAEAATVQ